MKKILYFLVISSLAILDLFANGVGIVKRETSSYLKLISSSVEVYVENQVAVITATQSFKNIFEQDTAVTYAFPMPDGASGTNLRWKINGEWFEAIIATSPDDSASGGGGGGTTNAALDTYLGPVPVYFSIPQKLKNDSLLTVELKYVQLLDYSFGNVFFSYPNNYQLIQSSTLEKQVLNFTLVSERTINSLLSLSHANASVFNNGDTAYAQIQLIDAPANKDYKLQYQLSLDELGLFSFSTFLSDSASTADSINGGYFVFIVEPEPTANILDKVFTLIIDRSGSMLGSKMTQAKNAAKFIIQNLNDGDRFNLIDFASDVRSFQTEHIPFNSTNESLALTYINSLEASGSTNISGAFSTAVPQFNNTNDTTANIIIFFTDGQATTGITETVSLVNHINTLFIQNESTVSLFSFGIGADVNQQLLSIIARENNGIADFLGSDELEDKISQFYLKIKNPVLLNTQMSFNPNSLLEVYPKSLPNLYMGEQLLIAGRYNENPPTQLTFSGKRFGQPVSYNYELVLTDSQITKYQFLPKVWAKKKIEGLLTEYYVLNPNSQQAIALKSQIIWLSVKYGILSPFTQFIDPLPVELMYFKATVMGSMVELSWSTSSEANNAGFFIERRFEESSWTEIGYVEGNGTSTQIQHYKFLDDLNEVKYRGNIYYRIKQVDFDGTYEYTDIVVVYIDFMPEEFSLFQNYPNPFNPTTTISYAVPYESKIVLKIFDILGNEIETLVNEVKSPGVYEAEFDASKLSSGVYIYKLSANNFSSVKKMILQK